MGTFYGMPFTYCNLTIPLTSSNQFRVRTNPDCACSATSRATRVWGRGRGTGTPTRPAYAIRRGGATKGGGERSIPSTRGRLGAHPSNYSGSGTPGTPSSSVWGRGRGRGTSPRPTCAVRRGAHCARYYGRGSAPPDQRTLPPSPSCPLVSRQCGKISGFAAKTADGATATQQSTRGGAQHNNLPGRALS